MTFTRVDQACFQTMLLHVPQSDHVDAVNDLCLLGLHHVQLGIPLTPVNNVRRAQQEVDVLGRSPLIALQ